MRSLHLYENYSSHKTTPGRGRYFIIIISVSLFQLSFVNSQRIFCWPNRSSDSCFFSPRIIVFILLLFIFSHLSSVFITNYHRKFHFYSNLLRFKSLFMNTYCQGLDSSLEWKYSNKMNVNIATREDGEKAQDLWWQNCVSHLYIPTRAVLNDCRCWTSSILLHQ